MVIYYIEVSPRQKKYESGELFMFSRGNRLTDQNPEARKDLAAVTCAALVRLFSGTIQATQITIG